MILFSALLVHGSQCKSGFLVCCSYELLIYALWACWTNGIPLSFILLWSHWGSITISSLSHLSSHLWPIYSVPLCESWDTLPSRHGRRAVPVPNLPSPDQLHCLLCLPPSSLLYLPLLLSGWNWLSRMRESQAEVMNLHCWGLLLWLQWLEDLACSRGSPVHS